jgi:hypothetical protein
MAAFNFPSSPTIGQVYQNYSWDGEKWINATSSGAIYVNDPPPPNAPVNSLWWNSANGTLYIRYNDGNSTQWVALVGGGVNVVRSYLTGLTLSTAGASASFGVAAGVAADSTNTAMMALAAAITKTTAAWAVGSGSGALDTGAIANSTWYHVHQIRRPDTGVVDVLISLSATAPTLPANYTQFRRIGSLQTNASAQWVAFTQLGDEFMWIAPPLDVNDAALGTTPKLYALSVPPGVQVTANIRGQVFCASQASVLISSFDETTASVATGQVTATIITASAFNSFGTALLHTDTSRQVRALSNVAATTLRVVTIGWNDRRGRDA